ncbi:hypothetical protein M5K25_008502 [Dendrobium thyrsiflorum]|uniref:PB1 domain-containing protein n=1 Tax=Dendrobium thyrsiflorum TaxID=117978 RepID=A0ABD0VFZ8_DENTH
MSTAATSACTVTMIGLLHSFRKYLHKPPVTLPSSWKTLLQPPVNLPYSLFHPSSIYLNSPTSKYYFFPMAFSPLITNRNPSSTTIPARAKHRSSRKVNIRCRFGGKLMPRLSHGALHYVGGRTRITDFRRDTTLQELYCKMEDIYGEPVVICYKLPVQNLDSLVSISSAEDLDNMLDKYDYFLEASKCGYPRLHVFLFPLSNRENSLVEFNDAACNDSWLSYIEEVNRDTKADGFKTYENENKEDTTSILHVDDRGDGNGNDNISVPEHQSFLAHSSINDEINVAPQIVNPSNNVPYVLPTYEEPHQIHYIMPSSFVMAHEPQLQNHQLYEENFLETLDSNSIFKNQDPWNVSGPSNIDSYFGHFRQTQELSTDEADEDLHNLIELVESVLQSH